MGMSQFQYQQMIHRMAENRQHPAFAEGVQDESDLHRQIMAYCNKQWPKWVYVHSRMDKRTTQQKGVPDFIIFAPHGLFIVECKRKGEKQTEDQRIFAKTLEMVGRSVAVVYSMSEFLEVVK